MKIQQPKISANLELKKLEEIFQDEDDIVEVAKIENANLSNKVLQRFVVYGSYIKDCDFSNSDLGRADFTDVIFENCDFSNAKMDHGSIHRVTFKNCRMTGTLFNYMRFGNIIFDEVKADFISVVDSK
ncbi:pentapeptide repeat-containing protein [Staphylococcus equorum]|uniref:pentapeptide repeat-containing protein n=1 Tax=Staphylococcus equorum TaxID=246432 RepID=UPI000A6D7646|nr:pentapeptide repeat-containing protein [Staphylococcus equorum]